MPASATAEPKDRPCGLPPISESHSQGVCSTTNLQNNFECPSYSPARTDSVTICHANCQASSTSCHAKCQPNSTNCHAKCLPHSTNCHAKCPPNSTNQTPPSPLVPPLELPPLSGVSSVQETNPNSAEFHHYDLSSPPKRVRSGHKRHGGFSLSLVPIPEDRTPAQFEIRPISAGHINISVFDSVPSLPPISLNDRTTSSDLVGGEVEARKAIVPLTPVLEDTESPCFTPCSRNPIVKFRRMARAVLLLIQVCHICKDILSAGVRKEPWFALIDNLIAKSTIQQKRKAPRAFVTFVPNERRELVQLTFDVAQFKRDYKSEFILTDDVRDMMSVMPGYRTPQQISAIIRVMKVLFPTYANYKLPTQKAIGQMAFYDRYKANRVIVKKGHQPDGLYFVLAGCMVEKHEGGRQPKLINAGEKFGEGDLLCGNRRRHTVLTKVDSEIFYLHRQDYRVIFDVSEDSNNPKNLDICRQHIVFQHFPMQRLVENPGTWSVNNYKYGTLIAEDLYDIDWIYVIKSGEARVIKYLQPGNIDVKARRRKTQSMVKNQSPFYLKKRILSFVEERKYIKSAYRPSTYRPSTYRPPTSGRLTARSAPLTSSRSQRTPVQPRPCISLPATRQGPRHTSARKSSSFTQHDRPELSLPRLVLDDDPDRRHRNSEVKVTEVKDDSHSNANGLTQVVEQETVEELPENLTSRSQSLPRAGGEGGAHSHEESSETGLLATDNGTNSEDSSTENTQDKSDSKEADTSDSPAMLGSELAGTTRMMGRRLSADMTGGLFDRPADPSHPGRRKSILIPPDEAAAVIGRRLSIAQPPTTTVGGGGGGGSDRLGKTRGRSASFLKTPLTPSARSLSPGNKNQVIQVGNHTLPAFVQVETLHPGQVFGLRACLDPEERGPTVSLVSGECEVLQINKKFFMRHCDDAIFSLIRLKNKPFPSEEDLIDRLDVNMQWEEFKQQTLHSFLKECRSAKR